MAAARSLGIGSIGSGGAAHEVPAPRRWLEGAPASISPRIGRWFASAAAKEARSATALTRRVLALREAGAPAPLADGLDRAIERERQHADAMRRFAGAHAAELHPATAASPGPGTLARLAAENVVEGCVHLTWAAAKARFQARHAADLEVRVVMAAIAADEARHASLSFRIDRWLRRALSPADQRLTDEIARWSMAKLRASRRGPALPYHRRLGLPDEPCSLRILDLLQARLWDAAA